MRAWSLVLLLTGCAGANVCVKVDAALTHPIILEDGMAIDPTVGLSICVDRRAIVPAATVRRRAAPAPAVAP